MQTHISNNYLSWQLAFSNHNGDFIPIIISQLGNLSYSLSGIIEIVRQLTLEWFIDKLGLGEGELEFVDVGVPEMLSE